MRPGAAILLFPLLTAASPAWADSLAPHVALTSGVEIAFVRVEPGRFTMGSPDAEAGRESDEVAHAVTLTQPFYLARTPVTMAQYQAFTAATGYRTEAEKGTSGGYGVEDGKLVQKPNYTWKAPGFATTPNHPVGLVTWADADAFAAWATSRTGHTVGLPTEAQYEFALRAGTRGPYYAGSTPRDAEALGWFQTNAEGASHPVGLKRTNALGLFDMVGDVREWCRDWYAGYSPEDAVDPVVTIPGSVAGVRERNGSPAAAPPEKARRVLRGGSFLTAPSRGRSAARDRADPGSRNADIGFRVVMEFDPGGADPLAARAAAESTSYARSSPPVPPSAPITPAATSPSPASAPRDSMGLPLGVAVVLGGALGLFVLASRRRRRLRWDGNTFAIQITPDGFWVRPPSVPPAGSRAHVAYRVGGEERSDWLALDPSPRGTFVYTGQEADRVRVLEVSVPGLEGDPPYPGRPPFSPPGSRTSDPNRARLVGNAVGASRSPSPRPFGGYPPAY